MFFVFLERQIKLLENSYIDDSIVCIVRKKVDNKLTNSPYVSLRFDITTDILVAKKLGHTKLISRPSEFFLKKMQRASEKDFF